MTDFPNPAARIDPYRSFKFRVKWDGRSVAGVSSVSGLSRTVDVKSLRSGGDPGLPYRLPPQSEYEAITLERGVTHDPAFEQWANKVWDYHNTVSGEGGASGNKDASLKDFRKDVTIEIYNEAGQLVMAYNIYRCWVSEYQALPELDANSNAVAVERIVLQNEGWERVSSVKGPSEPSYRKPKG